jgi:hypothetical protein
MQNDLLGKAGVSPLVIDAKKLAMQVVEVCTVNHQHLPMNKFDKVFSVCLTYNKTSFFYS